MCVIIINLRLDLSKRLKSNLRVKKVAPTYCTGHLVFKTFQYYFGENYVFAGLGENVKFQHIPKLFLLYNVLSEVLFQLHLILSLLKP